MHLAPRTSPESSERASAKQSSRIPGAPACVCVRTCFGSNGECLVLLQKDRPLDSFLYSPAHACCDRFITGVVLFDQVLFCGSEGHAHKQPKRGSLGWQRLEHLTLMSKNAGRAPWRASCRVDFDPLVRRTSELAIGAGIFYPACIFS